MRLIRHKITTVLLVSLLGLTTAQGACPAGDLDGNCYVDLQDMVLLVQQWLDPPGCSGQGCANLDGLHGVDFFDYAIVADSWQESGGTLVISEFMALNTSCFSTIVNGQVVYPDWLEIYNPTDSIVNLDGWYLTDNPGDLTQWPFPAVLLEPGEYLVVFASSKSTYPFVDDLGYFHTNFSLKASGEYLALVQPNGITVESFYEPIVQYDNVSYGLCIDMSEKGYFTSPTPKLPNGNCIPDPTRQIVINEIMYHPSSLDDREEYIELYNRSTNTVVLTGWRFSNGVDFVFPSITIGPKGYLVVAADVASFSAKYPGITNVVGGWDGHLSNKGETIKLIDNVGVQIDEVTHADQGDWGQRELGPIDQGHRGWNWISQHDGDGKSLELINPALPNEYGQNWATSLVDQGSPGQKNAAGNFITETTPLVTITDAWKYNQSGTSLGVDWIPAGYDDTSWPSGASVLAVESDFIPATINTTLTLGPTTYYFRKHFTLNEDPTGLILRLTTLIDDGAVFYLNGTEVLRLGVEAGETIYYSTLANQTVGNAVFEGPFDLPTDSLVQGDNVLAVEVHQVGTDSSDIVMGLTLDAIRLIENPASQNIAPMILEVNHSPIIPKSTDSVAITTRLIDENAAGFSSKVYYRVDGATTFTPLPMADDGLHGDGGSGDGIYGALILAQPDNTIVEFYLEAADSESNTRTWPAPSLVDGVPQQVTNLLYQVDDDFSNTWTPGEQPVYYIIMTEAERAELADIGDGFNEVAAGTGTDSGAWNGEALSNAEMNATFISADGVDIKVRYHVGARNRGHGSRVPHVGSDVYRNNYRINFVHDRPWQDVTAININNKYIHSQLMGNMIHRMAGSPAFDAAPVQVRVNGQNLAQTGGPSMFGSYVHLEVPDSDFADAHFPGDGAGNIYRCIRLDNDAQRADLRYEGTDPGTYRDTYIKTTNEEVDDWTDLINLTYKLSAQSVNNIPDENFVAEISQVINLDQWLRYLALDTLLLNNESGLNLGVGDDYQMYRGVDDPRFVLLPYDLDTLMMQGQPVGTITHSIFTYRNVAGFSRLLNHPEVVQRYYQAFFDLFDTIWNPETMNPLLDQILGDFVSSSNISAMKQFVINRRNAVLLQIPQDFSIVCGLPVANGYYYSTADMVELDGAAPAAQTGSILVNGLLANWSPVNGTWSIGAGTTGIVETLVSTGSVWKYLDNGTNQGTAWQTLGFADTTWASGPAQLGYGDKDEATVVSYGPSDTNKYTTTYFRHKFNVTNKSEITSLTLRFLRDDGGVVYLNNQEVVRSHMPEGTILYNTFASLPAVSDADEATYYTYSVDPAQLNEGENILAVEIHQVDLVSSDISFNLELKATRGQIVTSGVPLHPGINRIWVRTFEGPSGTGEVLIEDSIDVWYDDGTESTLSGTLTADTILDAASGPWHVTASVIVPAGITLTIEPGTTLFFDTSTSITVNTGGRLVAEGSEYELIRFTQTPGSAALWSGLQFSNTIENNRITYAILEYGQTTSGMIGTSGSVLTLDHVTFDHSGLWRIKTVNSSLTVRNCTFMDMFGPGEAPLTDNSSEQINGTGILSGGQVIIENNLFGSTHGHNDIIDFSGPVLPGPILQILNNTFTGGGDECLDLGGDAHIEGNRFMHIHMDVYNTGTGDSNAISTGDNLSGETSEITVVRNVFYDVDHAVNLKKDTYMFFENNTVLDVAEGGSAIKLLIPGRDPQGKGAYIDGCIFWNLPRVFEYVDVSEPYDPDFATDLEMHNSIVDPNCCSEVAGERPGTILDLGVGNICGDPRLADPTNYDFSLLSGSPALGSGPNGLDMGAIVPAGASIRGEPSSLTAQTSATLLVAGPGITHYRYALSSAPNNWSAERSIAEPIELTGLSNGTYAVLVIGKNYASVWQETTAATVSQSWTVDTALARVRINEVLAQNVSEVDHEGSFPDLIELYNDGAASLDLSGMSISDDPFVPAKFVFPAGTTLSQGNYLILYADDSAASGLHLGFSLDGEGEGVYLYDTSAQGGGLIDSVEFGVQVADLSIGRVGRVGQEGDWTLTEPTFGQANVPAQFTNIPDSLQINEWLANGQVLFVNDFIELYNSDSIPVALAGLYLTDHPVARPDKHPIDPLSFIAGNGYAVFIADDDEQQGLDHLNFKLSAQQGMIGLYDADLHEIDKVLYLGQMQDVSQGRSPDGTDTLEFFPLPTPGLANKGVSCTSTTTTLVPESAAKRVLVPSSDIGNDWRTNLNYDDSLWTDGTPPVSGKTGGIGYDNSADYLPYITYNVKTKMYNINQTCYIRVPFALAADLADFTSLTLKIRYDDAFVAYLNGQEVQRTSYVPDPLIWNSGATDASTENANFVEFNITSKLSALHTGNNLLAIHGLNYLTTSSDFLISPELVAKETVCVPEDPSYARAEAILNGLRITELMYNPAEGLPYDNDDYEFIELQNIGTDTLDLAGVRFTNGIDFTFPSYSLAAGEYVVIVKNLAAFQARYGTGILIAGVYDLNLRNSNEEIILQLPYPFAAAILRFEFLDTWYPATDGGGYSLEIQDPWAPRDSWSDPASWRQSGQVGGSPEAAD